MSRMRTGLANSALTAMVAAGAQGQTAFGAASASASARSRAAAPALTAAATRLSDFNRDGSTDLIATDKGGVMWRGTGTGAVAPSTLVSAAWGGVNYIVAPGNWDRASGNDLIGRDNLGHLWLFPGDNTGAFGPSRLLGNGWNSMSYIG